MRPITAEDARNDHAAVMANLEHLQEQFLEVWDWPKADLTLEQNVADLTRLESDFARRSSFTFTVVNHDDTTVVGCIYIVPSQNPAFDAEVTLWASRARGVPEDLDATLYDGVKRWMEESWPFANVAFPGRSIAWETYSN